MSLYKFVKVVGLILFRFLYKIKLHGVENIPNNKKVIICSNHSHFLDPPILGIFLPRQVNFMAKKELFEKNVLNYILRKLGAFPVNREGNDITAIKNALKILSKGQVLGIFPEGTRVDKFDLNNAKAGVSMLAIKSKAPIIPIYIDGSYKLFSKLDIYIGKPLEFDEYYNKKLNTDDYLNISQSILKSIYSMS